MPGGPRFAFLLGALAAFPGLCADSAVVPVTVCEVVRDLAQYQDKAVAVLGRYSFRQHGRWVAEQACDEQPPSGPMLWLVEDAKDGPKPPSDFEIDAPTLERKWADMRKRTSLAKFRFGTPDYDRWAVVYGRVETRRGEAAKTAPADLVFRGDGVVVFLTQ
jgi:hypothetical protein